MGEVIWELSWQDEDISMAEEFNAVSRASQMHARGNSRDTVSITPTTNCRS